ncbi:SusC/RagA family TonB-linked outer membrane protein [Flavobacterium azooxidireducens]|uniref:SusC/RagA family TonB-linked outer membrane protein n=1 Tax=Flavobacterium azooxidireducens TaxID=1871076 RepID=A0ABY4KC50_9FLAO|nr:SusC/RagA family TonB-linked outer membrane protein [Flavobacterium azooxidireducens]UPQ78357.1 SusC/RagA family TonB-linked outer membrane protein [Flavobacterium azooxidireducens]
MMVLPLYILAQEVKGTVVDKGGMPLPGVTIRALQTDVNTVTDFDGNFTINAQNGQDLEFRMIGMKTSIQKVTGSILNVMLEDDETTLDDVVLIGYGTRKKVDNTASIVSLTSEEVNNRKVLNATQAIQGKAAGVQVSSSDVPGSSPSVVIRGLNTALGGRNPLYIVDGVPLGDVNNINSSDILTYDVLKDASALAIYGNRGANGVIIITTKAGTSEKMTVEYDGFVGFRSPLERIKMAGSNKFSRYSNIALGTTTFSQDQPTNTNWFDEITRTGVYSQNNISVSGASKSIKYFFSAGLYDEKAILNGLDYKRITLRNNNDIKISDRLSLKQTLNIGITESNPKPLSAFTNAYKQSPIVPVYFPSGKYGVSFVGEDGFASETGSSFNNVGNPVAQLDYFNEEQRYINLQAGLTLDYKIMDGLKYTSQFTASYNNWKSYNFNDTRNIWLSQDPTRTEELYDANAPINLLTKSRGENFDWNLANFLTYNKVFSDIHDIEFTLGTEINFYGSNETLSATRRDVPANSNYWAFNFSTSNLSDAISNTVLNERRLLSYFGRAQYKLMDKYLITATLRRDGTSQYQTDYRWGHFPSFGLGWVVSNESFLKDNTFLNFLKLRGGWGRLGNERVPLNNQAFTSNLNSTLGGNIIYPGITINSQVDPSLSWEVIEELSVGVDFSLINSKLKGTFDIYDKSTTNLILNVDSYLTAGTSQASPGHVGEVTNKGVEFSLRWDDKIGENFSYWVGGNISSNKNNLESITNPNVSFFQGGVLGNGQYTKLLSFDAIDQPLGSFFLWEHAGFDETGQMQFFNADGDIVSEDQLTVDDRKFVGSVVPTSTYGISVGANYKNIDFSIDGYGTGGSKVYNGKKAQRFSGENIEYDVATDFWTPTNTSAANPAPFNSVPVASTYYLESGDFFRINNITLGYTLPKISEHITSVRIYANAINPFIFQKFSGFSPELNNDGDPYRSQGIEIDAYPTVKSFVFGVNLKF